MSLKRRYSELLFHYRCVNSTNIEPVIQLFCRNKLIILPSFKKYLIEFALQDVTENRTIYERYLEEIFKLISFKETADKRGKILGIVAGSFPAFLSKKVKRFNDIDIFLMMRRNDSIRIIRLLLSLCQSIENTHAFTEYYNGFTAYNFSKLQFIVHRYDACPCIHHLSLRPLRTFHNCTRFRLHMASSINNQDDHMFLTYLKDYSKEGICCRETAIASTAPDYPKKHQTNVTNLSPPSLYFQCLNVLMEIKSLEQNVLSKCQKCGSKQFDILS